MSGLDALPPSSDLRCGKAAATDEQEAAFTLATADSKYIETLTVLGHKSHSSARHNAAGTWRVSATWEPSGLPTWRSLALRTLHRLIGMLGSSSPPDDSDRDQATRLE